MREINRFFIVPILLISTINAEISGENLAAKALRYEEQLQVIQNAPTKTNDMASVSDLLATAATEIENRLETRAADANDLAAAAKTSTGYSTQSFGDGPSTCCQKGVETAFDSYFRSEVDLSNMCYRGSCNLAGRSLSGTPSCSASVIKGDFFTQVKTNLADPGSAWQYFGSETGTASMFPASYAGEENCPNDPYDPRLRSWYVQALTTYPMDVVIIVDKSGSMAAGGRMDAAHKAVKTILSMLRPYDRVAVTPFDSAASSPITSGVSCIDNKHLAFATSKNVEALKSFVDSISPGGATMYSYALRFAREIFEASNDNMDVEDEFQSQRKQVVMFISDGDPTDSKTAIFESFKQLIEAVPNVITMVYGLDVDNQILRDMAALNFAGNGVSPPAQLPTAGDFEKLTPADIRIKLGRFYANPSINPGGPSALVQYSLPYVDSFGMGLMVTASKAVIDGSGNLQGVVGYDVTLKYLLEPVEYIISETTYAWMFTRKRGYIIYHPRMINPSADVSDISPVHYSILETDIAQINALQSLIQSTGSQSMSYQGERFVEAPREQDFTSTNKGQNTQKEYFQTNCQTVSPGSTEFELVLCVTRVGDVKSTLDSESVPSASASVYHADQNPPTPCKHGFRRAQKQNAAVKFAPRQMAIPSKYTSTVENSNQLQKMDDIVNGRTTSSSDMNADTLSKAIATNSMMSGFDDNWKLQDDALAKEFGASYEMAVDMATGDAGLVPVWRYFGSIEGTMRMYPGTQMPQAYDPSQRAWFKQAMSDKTKTFISAPYEDAFGMGYVVTISKTTNYKNNGETAGVLGTDYFLYQFGESVLGQASSGAMLVDSSGFIIYHPEFHHSRNKNGMNLINVKFDELDGSTSSAEPLSVADIVMGSSTQRLFTKLLNGGIPMMQCHDVISLKTRKTLDFEQYFKSQNGDKATVAGVEIERIPGTNAFILKGQDFEINPSHQTKEETRKERDIKGKLVTIKDKWVHMERSNLVADAASYKQCVNKFTGGDSIPACQGTSPSLDLNYLGSFDWMDGFKNEDIKDLEQCFEFMQTWQFLSAYRNMKPAVHYLYAIIFSIVVVLILVLVVFKGKKE